MSTAATVKIFVIALAILLAMPLAAQRYQGRDHHVFHPPAQTKHQSAPSAATTPQMRASSTTAASAQRGHDANLNVPRGNDAARPPMPPGTDSVHPH